jgi:uncharacterized protein
MKKNLVVVSTVFVSLFLCSCFCFSFDVPEKPQGYVNDYANILPANSKVSLNKSLYSYYTKTSNQIMLVTIPSLDGGSLEDISMQIAEKWKAGQKDKDNGVILLVSVADKKMRIEVGYGLEPFLTDSKSALIIANVIAPEFKKGDYFQGLVNGLNAIIGTISKAENSNKGYNDSHRKPVKIKITKEQGLIILGILIVLILMTTAIDVLSYRKYLKNHQVFNDNYAYGEWWMRFSLQLIILHFLFQLLTMLFYLALLSGGGRGRGGSGGGFSSGGGGFGGGGASGGW